jgi:outer membrane protein OmpA-like peptidoglycan-associated protein
MSFEQEHNSVWYSFVPKQDALLSLTIIPDIVEDDYDFMLFECTNDHCCGQIASHELSPIRANISRPNLLLQGKTGLSNDGNAAFVHEGKGNNFSKLVSVKAGHKYFLVLDLVYGGDGGHRVNLSFKNFQISPPKRSNLQVTFKDAETQNLIDAKLLVLRNAKFGIKDTLINRRVSSLSIPLDSLGNYELVAGDSNFLIEKQSFTLLDNDTLIVIQFELQNASAGKSFDLKNVYFSGGSAVILANSATALRSLYGIMKSNPNLVIEIRGHVNLPNGTYRRNTEEYYNQLSIDRAKAVYDYLVKRGISKTRLSYQGYGYAQMVFPDATTEAEMQKNRRVEIVVIGNVEKR